MSATKRSRRGVSARLRSVRSVSVAIPIGKCIEADEVEESLLLRLLIDCVSAISYLVSHAVTSTVSL